MPQHFPTPPPLKRGKKQNTLPNKPGQVIGRVPLSAVRGTDELTDEELALLGWKPGDPEKESDDDELDADMRSQVEKAREEADDYHGLTPIDPSTPPLEAPTPTDIESLPPQEREEAEKLFREMDDLQYRLNALRKTKTTQHKRPPQAMQKPGAPQAFAVADKAERDFQRKMAEKDMPEKPNTPREKTTPFKVQTEERDAEQPQPENSSAEQNSTEQQAGGDLSGTTTYCPRCGFDLNGELVEPTQTDVALYLKAILEGGRFYKEVPLFGGRIVVTFRTLLPAEVDAALNDADKEVADGRIYHAVQYARYVEGLKLAAGIKGVSRAGSNLTYPELVKVEPQTDDKSAIREMYDYFNNEAFTTDSLRRVVADHWSRFNALVQHMEAKAEDPDFFGKTG